LQGYVLEMLHHPTSWTVVLAYLSSCGQLLWWEEVSSACIAATHFLISNQSWSGTCPRADFGCASWWGAPV